MKQSIIHSRITLVSINLFLPIIRYHLENWIEKQKAKKEEDKSYFIVLLIFVFLFFSLHPFVSDIMYLNFIQHDWRKYYNISKASTWLQNKSNGIAQERKSKFQFLSDLIYVLLFYVCFSFYNFFLFYFVRIKNVVLLRRRITKKTKSSIVLFSVYYFTFYLIFEFIVKCALCMCVRLLLRLVRWVVFAFVSDSCSFFVKANQS